MGLKWIKINLHMFDDEKVKIIENMPEGDSILIIWVKLLTQAGKTNMNGWIMLTENVPYNPETLATIFNRPLNTVRLALQTFQELDMIECDEGGAIGIKNWSRYQNVEGMDKIRESNRERQKKFRERKKQETLDEPKDDIPYQEIIQYLNEKANKKYRASSQKTKKHIRARWKENNRVEDFKRVIDNKCASWMGGDMEKYLRPETLFGTKFEGYLNESGQPSQNNENAFDAFLNGE